MRLVGRCVGVVGGGIGGLATAVALRSRGASVVVYERARRQRQGVALLVWGNATRALASLGVAEPLLAVAAPIERMQVRSPDGDLLSELPIGEWSKRAEMPSIALRRGDLIAALAARLDDGMVREGVELASFAHDRGGVRARFTDGTEQSLDALIGADGLHSRVRAQLLGDDPPRALRQQAWVGSVDAAPGLVERGIATATIGRGPRFWSAPLAHGAFWYATLNDVIGDQRDVLHETFAGWHAPIRALLEATPPDDIVATQICDRAPVSRWGEGCVTLLGDAAHASTPDLGQGACQAIESAAVLARCLDGADALEAGLRAYERARMQRTATVSRLCWMTSVNSTIESPTLCRLRDAAVRVGLRAVARGHLEWLLAGQPC
jgi:2-polyprenyl-6-methoxyphenol hydroxylase-like FAD-dependent oxidoreductase